ncbi:MAG: SRPBCC family protein [Candidatus Eremiobacteraeota bacterium]|nr:SRPBCC family protein [Candidatus Eremiobacteraeota bacterium]
MTAEQSIEVRAPAQRVYALAQDIARWPDYLPHYRYVSILRDSGSERVAVMAARRDWIPVRWTALERLLPEVPRIEFTHLSGWTKGLEVAWLFASTPDGTRVTITHDLRTLQRPLLQSRLACSIIANFFIQPIASRTLARMKLLAEDNHED